MPAVTGTGNRKGEDLQAIRGRDGTDWTKHILDRDAPFGPSYLPPRRV
jgi:hypothetical protein